LIARSRTEPASRVERARILLGYWENSSFFAVGQALGLHHQTVQRYPESELSDTAAYSSKVDFCCFGHNPDVESRLIF
jgi:hypothetical protein